MEINWERTLPLIELNKKQIYYLVDNIIDTKDIKEINIISEGCRTTNYLLKLNSNKKFILKIFFLIDESYEREIEIFNKIKAYAPVPQIYKLSDNPIINNRKFVIYEYLEGVTMSKHLKNGNILSENFIKEIARVMAKLHNNKYNTIGFLNDDLVVEKQLPPLFEWYQMFMGEKAQERLGENIIVKIQNLIKIYRNDLDKLDTDSRLIHGDLQGTNILIKHNNLSGIIDWEFCMAGHPLSDIGQFFRYDEYFNQKLIDVFENEYKKNSNYILDANWYKLSKIRDLANLLQLINNESYMPNKYFDIKILIEKIICSFENAKK